MRYRVQENKLRTKRQLCTTSVQNVVELHVHALCGFWAQIRQPTAIRGCIMVPCGGRIAQGTHTGREQQVEISGCTKSVCASRATSGTLHPHTDHPVAICFQCRFAAASCDRWARCRSSQLIVQLVNSNAPFARVAFRKWVRKVRHVTRSLPYCSKPRTTNWKERPAASQS